jgi:Carboxypeptidase regulatory-like domain
MQIQFPGHTRTTTTNAAGKFRADDFPTGSLTVTVEHPGFTTLVRSGIQLLAADTITVNLQLNVGNVQQTMEVTAEASLVQTQNAAVTTAVTNQQIAETPVIGRSFTQMLQVVSGASPTTAGMTEGLSSYGMRASTSVSLNGSTAQNNSYMIDGIDDVAPWLNNLVVVPPLDAVQEQRLEGANYSAEYGSAAGAVTVVQTKSGTNQLHGTVYEYLRNNDFNANTFFGNKTGTPITAYHRNQFGANAGGRVIKDKSFFFIDYEGTRVVQPSLSTTTIPTAAEQQMVETGNFGAFGTTIYDPTTNVGGLRTPFPGNQIPASRLDPAAVKLFQLLPTPTNPGTSNNFTFAPFSGKRVDQYDLRFDQNLFSADRLFVKWAYENTTGLGGGTLPAPASPPFPTGPYVSLGSGFAGNSQMNNWSLTTNYVKIIRPTIVNEFRAGAVRTDLSNLLWDNDLPISTELGIPNLNISNTQMGFPAITLPGFVGAGSSTSSTSAPLFGSTNSYPELQHGITYQYQDILRVNKGTHFMKFGVEFYRDDFDGHTSNSPRGYFDFDGQYTRQVGSSTDTTALSDFALGAWDGSQRSTQYGIFGARRWRLAAFAEDNWRANSRAPAASSTGTR